MTSQVSVSRASAAPTPPTAALLSVQRYEQLAHLAWDEPIAEVLKRVLVVDPDGGTGLVAACRSGVLVRTVLESPTGLRRVMAVDADREFVNLARDAVRGVDGPSVYFHVQAPHALTFADDVFSLAVCGGGLSTTASLMNGLAALARVVRPGGQVVVACLDASAFPLLWEVLTEVAWTVAPGLATALDDAARARVDARVLRDAATRCGLETVSIERVSKRIVLGEAVDTLAHPLLEREWLSGLRPILDGDTDWAAATGSRLAGWFGDALVEDQVSLLVAVLRVVESETVAVGEADVLREVSASAGTAASEVLLTHSDDNRELSAGGDAAAHVDELADEDAIIDDLDVIDEEDDTASRG